MAQVHVHISDEMAGILETICEELGVSKSGLCADYIRQGMFADVEKLTKLHELRSLRDEKKSQRKQGSEPKK